MSKGPASEVEATVAIIQVWGRSVQESVSTFTSCFASLEASTASLGVAAACAEVS